jgi:tRNA pseudouridine65 synthase
VHRLDRGTSGCLVFALHAEAARRLQALLEAGGATKRYVALVRGVPAVEGAIDHPIPRAPDGPRVPAFTAWRRLAVVLDRYALVEDVPRTGRLHQVRRHMKHLSHPIIGDVNYGKGEHNRFFRERYGLHRLALHAASLELPHPMTDAPLVLHAPLPSDLADPLERAGLAPDVRERLGRPEMRAERRSSKEG